MKPELPSDITTEQFLSSFIFDQARVQWMNNLKYGYPKSLENQLEQMFQTQLELIYAQRSVALKKKIDNLRAMGKTNESNSN